MIAEDCTSDEPCQLIIDLEVPQVQFLHTACLCPLNNNISTETRPRLLPVGQPMFAELSIQYTRQWDFAWTLNELSASVKFYFNILAEPTTWLISGQTQGCFSAKSEEVFTSRVALIPLKAGFARLPSVEVTPIPPEWGLEQPSEDFTATGIGAGHLEPERTPSCETDCISRDQGVRVIENLQNTTLGIGSDEKLESEIVLLTSDFRHSSNADVGLGRMY